MGLEQPIKRDEGKLPLHETIFGFRRALVEVAKCAQYGHTHGYAKNSWRLLDRQRLKNAQFRHEFEGDSTDTTSGLPNAAHAAWNALAYLELLLENRE